jgi:hypothetical protein
VEYCKKTEFIYPFGDDIEPEGNMPFQDCGYPYIEESGERKVHEQVVLLVRDSSQLNNEQIQFMEIQLNEEMKRTDLININVVRNSAEPEDTRVNETEPEEQAHTLLVRKNQIIDPSELLIEPVEVEKVLKVIHGTFQDIDDLSGKSNEKIFNVTAVMRQTRVDFYYNFQYLSTLWCEAEDMDLTFEDLYLKIKPPTLELLQKWCREKEEALLRIWLPPGMQVTALTEMTIKQLKLIADYQQKSTKVCTIGLTQKSQISSNVIRVREVENIEDIWKKITQIRVKDYARFYVSFCQEKTFVFVGHDRFVSVYNMSTEKWIFHENMHDEVRSLWTVAAEEDLQKKKEQGFLLHLRCIVGAGTVEKLTFVLPGYSKDKASGTQPQISVQKKTMRGEDRTIKSTNLGGALVGHLFKQTAEKMLQQPLGEYIYAMKKKTSLPSPLNKLKKK